MTNEFLMFENIPSVLFESISHGIIYYDHRQNIIFINSAAKNILGLPDVNPPELNLEDLKWEILDCEDSHINPFLNALENGKKAANIIFRTYNFENKQHRTVVAKIIPQHGSLQNNSVRAFIVFDLINEKPAPRSHQPQPGGIELLHSILNQIPDTIYIKDKNGRFIHINNAQVKMLGIASPDEAIGKSDFDFFPLEHAKLAYNDEKRIMRTGSAIKDKTECIKRENKKPVWVSTTKIPVRDKNGLIIGTAGISRDITEKKINEEILKKSEAQLRAIWENSFTGMRLINYDGTILLVNEAFCNLVGKKRKDLVGMNFSTIYNSAERDNILLFEKKQFFDKKVNTFVERDVTLWNGVKAIFEISHRFINVEGEQPLLLSIFRDVTESKKIKEALISEKEELDVTLKSIADGVITTDLNDCIKIVNSAAENILGWNRNDLAGKSIFDVFELVSSSGKPDSGVSQLNFSDISSLKQYYSDGEIVVISSKDGSSKILTFCSTEIKSSGRKPIGFVYVLRDITERVKVETQLNLSLKMESIGQLAAGIAHEINTPMQYIGDNNSFIKNSFNSFCQFIDFLRNEPINSTYGNCEFSRCFKEKEASLDIGYLINEIPVALEQSQIGIERVNNIISAIKDFAHPGGRQKAFFNINKGIEVTVAISKNEWKYVADLVTKLDPDLPPVYCSLDEINQVILNMIINSAHAIEEQIGRQPNEKGKIFIESNYLKNEDFVEIKITDTGSGIPKEYLTRIFDPFFTTKRVGKGTGQGLTIAHNIVVNKHSGKIFAESAKGKGTIFTICLPVNNFPEKGD